MPTKPFCVGAVARAGVMCWHTIRWSTPLTSPLRRDGDHRQLHTVAGGTDYNGRYRAIYTKLLGADRVEERLLPYGDLVRSGAVVTYGSDIRASTSRRFRRCSRSGFGHPPASRLPDDLPLVPRQRIGLHDTLRGYTANGATRCGSKIAPACWGPAWPLT